jgi:hypothetical protein
VIGINRTGMGVRGLKGNGKGVEGRGIKSKEEGGRGTKRNRVEGERDNEELHGREMKED